MKAIGIRSPMNMQDMKVMDIAVPEIAPIEVRVRMRAVGVGIHDRWALPPNPRFPFAIGLEGAGIVDKVGSEADGFAPGDRVFFTSSQQPKGGTWAEYAAVPAEALIAMPEGLDFIQAAALPIAGQTALEAIKALRLDRGATVFIAGASGAIGTLAIQLARQRGWRVAASSSPKNHDHLRDLGAELAVDYNDPDWPQQVRAWAVGGVDGAIAIQPGTGATSLPAVRAGGQLITISGDQMRSERGVAVQQMMHHPETRSDLEQLAADVAAGRIHVVLDRVYPFDQGLDALAQAETRHARGKLIIKIAN